MTGSSAVTAIERFEESTKLHDFKQFHIEQARAFKKPSDDSLQREDR
jgi:hypothetical protein